MEQDMNPNRYTYGGSGSHWDGCHETHWDCRIAWLEREVERLREQITKLSEPTLWYCDEAGYTASSPEDYAGDEYMSAGDTFELYSIKASAKAKYRVVRSSDLLNMLVEEVPNE